MKQQQFKLIAIALQKKEVNPSETCDVVIFRNGRDPVLFNATEKDVGDAIICAGKLLSGGLKAIENDKFSVTDFIVEMPTGFNFSLGVGSGRVVPFIGESCRSYPGALRYVGSILQNGLSS